MAKRRWGLTLAVGIILIMLLCPAASYAVTLPGQAAEQAQDVVPRNVLITYYQPPDAGDLDDIVIKGGIVKKAFNIVPTVAASLPDKAIQALQKNSRIRMIEEDSVWQNCVLGEVLPWGVDRVDAEQAHPTNKGTGVKVAVLDTGIDLDHPDLAVAGNVTFVPGTVNGDDDNGHGTHVAGVIGALDNEDGVIGVAPECSLYAVKVLNINGDAVMSVVLSGLEWCLANNMQVINLSFGSSMGMPQSVIDAMNNCYNAGMVLVAGAGNGGNQAGDGDNIYYPAGYAPVIAVGSTDEYDVRCPTSSTGWDLELMAPGNNIYSTTMGGGYGLMSTTSTASPHAAGVAALLIHSGLTSNVDVRYRLRSSSTDLGVAGWDTRYGNGLINIMQALNFSEPPDKSAPVTTISLSGTQGTYGWYRSDVTVTISAVDSGGSGVAQTEYSLDGGSSWNAYTAPLVFSSDTSGITIFARSTDNTGNLEGPCVRASFKIDQTPPTAAEVVDPVTIPRAKKAGVMMTLSYSGTAQDATSGLLSTHTVLIDEYGEYDHDFGGAIYGSYDVEQWVDKYDLDGRVYTVQLTVTDTAGNQATAQAICTVTRY